MSHEVNSRVEELGFALQENFEEGFLNDSDPSVLRFLIASRQEVSSTQLRDDLLSMLVAGHETTASALTWTLHLLANNPEKLAKVWPVSQALDCLHSVKLLPILRLFACSEAPTLAFSFATQQALVAVKTAAFCFFAGKFHGSKALA